MTSPYSKERIKKIKKSPSPRVLLNVCTHGSERVGLLVAKHFEKVRVARGTLVINIANTLAVKRKKRFITHDLNRVFPGKERGSYEERLAFKMTPFIKSFDLVIDVHSTESGLASTLISTSVSEEIKKIVRIVGPKQAVYMSATRSNALISVSKLGIAFEYGADADPKTLKETVRGIERILHYYRMLDTVSTQSTKVTQIQFFEAYSMLEKPEGYKVYKNLKNFQLVRKGTPVGFHPTLKEKLEAPENFYPILFGNNTYKKIFGFQGKKLKLSSKPISPSKK